MVEQIYDGVVNSAGNKNKINMTIKEMVLHQKHGEHTLAESFTNNSSHPGPPEDNVGILSEMKVTHSHLPKGFSHSLANENQLINIKQPQNFMSNSLMTSCEIQDTLLTTLYPHTQCIACHFTMEENLICLE